MLITRQSFPYVLAVLLAMCGAEALLFMPKLASAVYTVSLDSLISKSFIMPIFAVAAVLVLLTVSNAGCDKHGKCEYTLYRLQVSRREIFLVNAVYNAFCFVILAAVQVIMLYIFSSLYQQTVEGVSPQSVFLIFWQNRFAHTLLPLDEISRYIRNGFMIIALGLTSAVYPIRRRLGKFYTTHHATAAYVAVYFNADLGNLATDVIAIVISLIAIGDALYKGLVIPKEENDESEE